jgi:hypothetical protein
MHCSIAENGKCMQWSKQWSIELFLTALRSGDAHPIVGHPITPYCKLSILLPILRCCQEGGIAENEWCSGLLEWHGQAVRSSDSKTHLSVCIVEKTVVMSHSSHGPSWSLFLAIKCTVAPSLEDLRKARLCIWINSGSHLHFQISLWSHSHFEISFFCKRTQILSNYQHVTLSPFATQSLTQTRRNTIDRAHHAQHVNIPYPGLNLSSNYHLDILHQYRQSFNAKYFATSRNTDLAT